MNQTTLDPEAIKDLPENVIRKTGNVFDTDCQTVVVTVNLVGAMGRGLALYAKKKYPGLYERYRRDLSNGRLRYGSIVVYRSWEKWIVLLPTKVDWKNKSDLGLISVGLEALSRNIDSLGITSIAMTWPGCGNGWLDRSDVLPVLCKWVPESIPVELYE